jgi:hypothetical protein
MVAGNDSQIRAAGPEDKAGAVARLLSLHDGDVGVMALMLAGPAVIPAVRAFLFERERSGIYQPRCWAVDVLAALHAYDVLGDYLQRARVATDPVERAGDEAIANAAARALSKLREEWVFDLMLDLAQRETTPGVVEALGAFDRPEAVPHLIDALAEDDCRAIAESALQRLGSTAVPALIQAALTPRPSRASESETSLRQRRSALGLLSQTTLSQQQWHSIRELVVDQDARVAVLACALCPADAPSDDKCVVIWRLNELLPTADWVLAMEIKHCLDAYCETRSSAGSTKTLDEGTDHPGATGRPINR